MGVRLPSVASTTLVTTTLVTTAETVVLTSPPLNISLDFQQVLIQWFVINLMGTSSTSLAALLRRGTTTAGTLLNINQPLLGGAATRVLASGCYIDTPGAVAGQQYSITLTQASASANGTVGDGCIIVMAL